MIQLDRIKKVYAGEVLFQELSWQLRPGKRIGLIGPNGAGKTTLFRLITGEEEADGGRVVLPGDLTVGMLPQELDALEDKPALDVVLEGRQELIDLEVEIEAVRIDIDRIQLDSDEEAAREELERLSIKLGDLEHRFEVGGGYEVRTRARSILGGMGFTPDEESRPASELSGGWRMRLVLSQLLLQRPDVLLLDEPTNHLDVPSLEWLEGFLQGYEGTIVVVSHDRYFLNRLVNEISALEPDGFHTFAGNYDAYMSARELRLDQLRKERAQQERKIKDDQRFIDRFRYKATKAKQVQSRVKRLEKIDLVPLPEHIKQITFSFPDSPRAGRSICRFWDATKRYGQVTVYEDLNYEIIRGERIALVGPNGGGKSTLLKLISGEIEPDRGKVDSGHKVELGYFAQHQIDALDLSNTVLSELEYGASDVTRPRCRTILGSFLFTGDDVEKRVSVLSGGERSRLALAKLLLRPTNLLLLDEPTNHLDIASRDVLVRALSGYTGTIVFVSHDRGFINALATGVLHIENQTCVSYPGDYEYYRFKRQQELEISEGVPTPQTVVNKTSKSRDRKAVKRHEAELRKEVARRTRDLRRRLEATESEISTLEARSTDIEVELANPDLYDDPDRLTDLTVEHARNKRLLPPLYDTWADLTERIEMLEAEVYEAAES